MRTRIVALFLFLYLPFSAGAQLRIATNSDSLVIPVSKVGFSRQGSIRLSNISNSAVHINSMSIVPFFAFQYEFDIYLPAVTSFDLDSGASINIVIKFAPQTASFHSAGLLIETDEGTKEVIVYGSGITLQPDIVIAPDTIDFGTLAPGDHKDTSFLLVSGGKDIATIDNFEMANDYGSAVFGATPDSHLNFPFDVPVNDTVTLTAHFSAFGPNGDRTGRVILEGLATGITECEFRGKVGWPDLAFSPQIIDLGAMPQGSSADTFVYIVSTGESPVKLTKIDSPSAPFKISGIPIFPKAIAPGDSIKIGIHFDAISPGDFNTQFTAYAKPISVYLLNSTAFLKASVIPHVLSLSKPQPFNISCAIDSVYQQKLTIFDTGQYPFSITAISCSDPRFVINDPLLLPDTINPGVNRNMFISFTSVSGTTDTSCILTFFSNGRVALTDTLYVTTFADHAQLGLAPIISASKKPYSDQVGISSASDLSRFAIHTLSMDFAIDPPDVAEIDTLNVSIDNSVFPNAVVKMSYNSTTRVYHAFINSTTTLPASAAKTFMQIPLHYFVAKDTSAVLHISVLSPEREGCLSFSDDNLPVSATGGCGDPQVRNLLNNAPLISGMIISPNPSGSNRAIISFFNSENISLSVILTDIKGSIVYSSKAYAFISGKGMVPLEISFLPSGVYSVHLSAFSPQGQSQNIFSTIIIAR